jgi:hypothetical protein
MGKKSSPGDLVDHMLALAKHLFEGGEVDGQWIKEHCHVSRPTAYRYMIRLERGLPCMAEDRPTGTATGGFGRTRRVLRLMKTAKKDCHASFS